jgi:hypothetical protein
LPFLLAPLLPPFLLPLSRLFMVIAVLVWNASHLLRVGDEAITIRLAHSWSHTAGATPLRAPLRSVTKALVTSELLQRVAAMPATRKHTGFRRRAALANMVISREQQCYPRSALAGIEVWARSDTLIEGERLH